MNRFKLGMVVLMAGILVCLASFMCEAADMTKGELANVLVAKLGIGLPANSDQLSEAELYDVQSKLLAARGIALFEKAKSDWKVFSCDLANVLYDALNGPNKATIKEKFDFLANKGYMTNNDYKCEMMNAEDVVAILNIPELSAAIVQAYSLPVFFGAAGGEAAGIPPAPSNPEQGGLPESTPPPPEPPASPTVSITD